MTFYNKKFFYTNFASFLPFAKRELILKPFKTGSISKKSPLQNVRFRISFELKRTIEVVQALSKGDYIEPKERYSPLC
ncbi:hypothetical protein FHR29_000914 [Sphingobacterium sp. JUb56]|nr:hypothetical protein [Sphingobacterium sp. JUb56]